ncbi:hypothetical protein MHU86_12514 [Fragilaria crotonensis]|nr:hypothetical protein MHU86_12514 [Fragilaria crotonensis]
MQNRKRGAASTKDPAFDTATTRKDDITHASTVEGSDWRSWSMVALQFVWNTRALTPDSELQAWSRVFFNGIGVNIVSLQFVFGSWELNHRDVLCGHISETSNDLSYRLGNWCRVRFLLVGNPSAATNAKRCISSVQDRASGLMFDKAQVILARLNDQSASD